MSDFLLSSLTVTAFRSVNMIYSEAGSGNQREDRACFALVYKFEGKSVYRCGDRTLQSGPDTTVLLPRGSCYSWHCLTSGRFYILEFDAEGGDGRLHTFPVHSQARVLSLFDRIRAEGGTHPGERRLPLLRDLYDLLAFLQASAGQSYLPSEKKERLAPALAHLATHYDKPIYNDELAALCGMSTVYFRKLFTEVYGMPPIGYLNCLRIEHAKEMLRSDFGLISDVAFSLGYPTAAHFSATFKEHTGLSPRAYLHSLAGGAPAGVPEPDAGRDEQESP